MNGHAPDGYDQFIADQQAHNHDDMTDKELFDAIVNEGADAGPKRAACGDEDGHDHAPDIL